jgi:hypothetical protein
LRQEAADDERSRSEQERLRSDYIAFREERARRRWKSQRLVTRLRNGPETFLEEIDRKALRFCRSCEEVTYPDPERTRYERGRYDVAFRCHFCDGRALTELEPAMAGRGGTGLGNALDRLLAEEGPDVLDRRPFGSHLKRLDQTRLA